MLEVTHWCDKDGTLKTIAELNDDDLISAAVFAAKNPPIEYQVVELDNKGCNGYFCRFEKTPNFDLLQANYDALRAAIDKEFQKRGWVEENKD